MAQVTIDNPIPNSAARVEGLNLIIEVSGQGRTDRAAKMAAARTLRVPAVNSHGGSGRWAVVEATDPWDALGAIRGASVQAMAGGA